MEYIINKKEESIIHVYTSKPSICIKKGYLVIFDEEISKALFK